MATQKVLIVDDSKVIRMQIQEMLPKGNFEILEAQDGVEGLELIQQMRPNLVLLDFFMPRMNGWEVVQRIQADPALTTIPVVMMSGRKEDVMATVPELFDYFEFLSKPFDGSVLLRAIKIAMAKAKTRLTPSMAAAAPTAAPAGSPAPSSTNELQQLKAEMLKLQRQNALMQRELEAVKKQLAQVIAFVKQKLS
jgi:CheY-like chemotaxis protein